MTVAILVSILILGMVFGALVGYKLCYQSTNIGSKSYYYGYTQAQKALDDTEFPQRCADYWEDVKAKLIETHKVEIKRLYLKSVYSGGQVMNNLLTPEEIKEDYKKWCVEHWGYQAEDAEEMANDYDTSYDQSVAKAQKALDDEKIKRIWVELENIIAEADCVTCIQEDVDALKKSYEVE